MGMESCKESVWLEQESEGIGEMGLNMDLPEAGRDFHGLHVMLG